MFVRLQSLMALLGALMCMLSWESSTARAYCRTHTLDPGQSSCPPVCPNKGIALAWRTARLSYGFNERGFPGLSDAQLRATIARSFQTWQDVTCNGENIGFEFEAIPGTTALEQGPQSKEPNENVIVHYDPAGWAALDYSPRAFAITAVWFADTGEIRGADIGFNGGMDRYGDCAVDQCTNVGLKTDLQNVATHEIGHFLGLSHTDVLSATMSCEANASDTNKRRLGADDLAGICTSYPAATAFPTDKTNGGSSGCSLAPWKSETERDLAVLGIFGVALALPHRRRAK